MNSSTSSLSESIEISGEADEFLLLAFDVDDLGGRRDFLGDVESTSSRSIIADEPTREMYSSISEHPSSSESDDDESESDDSRLLRVKRDDGVDTTEREGEERELREEDPEEDNKLEEQPGDACECGDGEEDKDSDSQSLSFSSVLPENPERQSCSYGCRGTFVDVQA